jgi:hypothetical protein
VRNRKVVVTLTYCVFVTENCFQLPLSLRRFFSRIAPRIRAGNKAADPPVVDNWERMLDPHVWR